MEGREKLKINIGGEKSLTSLLEGLVRLLAASFASILLPLSVRSPPGGGEGTGICSFRWAEGNYFSKLTNFPFPRGVRVAVDEF